MEKKERNILLTLAGLAVLLLLALAAPATAADLTIAWTPQPGATATNVLIGAAASVLSVAFGEPSAPIDGRGILDDE